VHCTQTWFLCFVSSGSTRPPTKSRIIWIDAATHEIAVNTLLAAGRRGLSLVDCISFVVMRRLGLKEVLALDRDFARQGFRCRP
jgi:predicted nucleic acid-binding protein